MPSAPIRALQHAGFDMKKLSIIGRDYHTDEHAVGFYNTGDRVKYWGRTWRVLGRDLRHHPRAGVLLDSRHRPDPDGWPHQLGADGNDRRWRRRCGGRWRHERARRGIGGPRLPKDTVIRYEAQLKANKFLLIASGSLAEIDQARRLLAEHNGQVELHAREGAGR